MVIILNAGKFDTFWRASRRKPDVEFCRAHTSGLGTWWKMDYRVLPEIQSSRKDAKTRRRSSRVRNYHSLCGFATSRECFPRGLSMSGGLASVEA